MKILVFLLGAAVLLWAFMARVEADDRDPIQLCGARLLQNIRWVCRSVSSSTTRAVRRSDPLMPTGMDNEFENSYNGDSDYYDGDNGMYKGNSPWGKLIVLRALAEAMAHPRVRRDITKDCCHQACTAGHIRKYYCPKRRQLSTTPAPNEEPNEVY